MAKGMNLEQIAHLIGIGKRVVLEYTRIATHFHPELAKKHTLRKARKLLKPHRGQMAL